MSQTSETPERQGSGDLPTINMYQDIVDRAHTEVMHVREVYKWLIASLTIIISVGLFLAVYLTYNNIHEMRADMKSERADIKADMKAERAEMKAEVELMKMKAKQEYLQLEADLKLSVEKKVQNVESSVNSRIDTEFNKENIQGLVRDKAQERIDKVADIYIGRHIAMKIAPKINAVDKSVKDLEKSVEFNSVSSAANNDDRFAFEQLQKWANDKSYPLRDKAEQSLSAIISSKDTSNTYLATEYTYPWKPGTDPTKWKITQLRNQYQSDLLPGFRVALIEYLNSRNDISKKEKLVFLNEVIKTDKSLDVVLHAAVQFNKLTGQKFDPYVTKLMLEWYDKHSREIQ